jgi:hypothetical protein
LINNSISIKKSFLFLLQRQMKCEAIKVIYTYVQSVSVGRRGEKGGWGGGVTVAAVRDVICDGRVMTTG